MLSSVVINQTQHDHKTKESCMEYIVLYNACKSVTCHLLKPTSADSMRLLAELTPSSHMSVFNMAT